MTERSVFLAALDIDDPAARSAFLDETCAAAPDLRVRVEELLAAHARSASFMGRPASDRDSPGSTAEFPATKADRTLTWDGASLLVGRYQLLAPIGEGGMGTVYRAEQVQPVKRTVAVKLIKLGMDSRAVLNRFEAERQALALMSHPNISKVLDAGVTPDGRPFFVMELVSGVPLTEYCDTHKLPVADRLELFRQVCQAIQHAHQKGIIHRDLKPSNILVETPDGKPVPKVIDFGLAKAVGEVALTEKTLVTTPGFVVGTPLYMAPEQAGPNAQDVDTRADVYALGAVLYELLTG
ncbi:MAG TPA: serine/threonine-protein kinase, partial [Fimbriiglobus sp.]